VKSLSLTDQIYVPLIHLRYVLLGAVDDEPASGLSYKLVLRRTTASTAVAYTIQIYSAIHNGNCSGENETRKKTGQNRSHGCSLPVLLRNYTH